MKSKINVKKLIICIVIAALLTALYFSFLLMITYDSTVYYAYLNIFTGKVPFSSWQAVRGPSFPLLLYLITKIFGATEIGLLIGTFIFFVLALFISFKLVQVIQKDLKERKINNYIISFLFLFLIMFNPLIIGYYHVLLTEFVAATAALLSCYLAFKWINIEFVKEKLRFVIYAVIFCVLSVFMWFIKQPYVIVSIFPLFIATILSIIKIGNIRNVISKVLVFLLTIICVILGIWAWGKILVINDVTSKGTTPESYVTLGMIASLSDFHEVDPSISHSQSYIENSEYLDSSEISEAESILNGNSSYKDFEVYEVVSIKKGLIFDRIVVPYINKGAVSDTDVIKFFEVCIKTHPLHVIDSYVADYLALADIIPYQANYAGYSLPIKKVIPIYQFWNENLGIGFGTYYNTSTFQGIEDRTENMTQYYLSNDPSSMLNRIMKIDSKFSIISYKITFVLIPILSIFFFVKYCVDLKKKRNTKYILLYEMLTILFGYAFLHVLFHVFTGLIIDRYTFVAYQIALLGIILLFNFVDFNKIKKWFTSKFTKR